MGTTDRQELLVTQRKKPIDQILRDTLELFRGERNFVVKVAGTLDISVPTLHAWCKKYEIDMGEYRLAVV